MLVTSRTVEADDEPIEDDSHDSDDDEADPADLRLQHEVDDDDDELDDDNGAPAAGAAEPLNSPQRMSLMMSFVPSIAPLPVSDDIAVVNLAARMFVGANVTPFATMLDRQIVGLLDTEGAARSLCRHLYRVLSVGGVDVAPTFESARDRVALASAGQFVPIEKLAVNVHVKSAYRLLHPGPAEAPVTFANIIDALANAIVCRRQALERSTPGTAVSLASAVRSPTPTETAEGRAAFEAYHNNGRPLTSAATLPHESPTNVFASAAMFESRMQFANHIAAGFVFVGLSFYHDAVFLYRTTAGTVLRMQVLIDDQPDYIEICQFSERMHDPQHIYWAIVDPALTKLRAGMRLCVGGGEYVDVVGSLFDMKLDKLAYVDFMKRRGRATALSTTAAPGTVAFRHGPISNGRLQWRSLDAMMAYYETHSCGPVGKSEDALALAGMHLWRGGMIGAAARVEKPFYMSPNLDCFRNAGALRMWSCYIHLSIASSQQTQPTLSELSCQRDCAILRDYRQRWQCKQQFVLRVVVWSVVLTFRFKIFFFFFFFGACRGE
jgi:hypothetical protein